MKTHLLKLIEGFIKEEYNLEWVDVELNIKDANGSMTNIGHLYYDNKNPKSWEECE